MSDDVVGLETLSWGDEGRTRDCFACIAFLNKVVVVVLSSLTLQVLICCVIDHYQGLFDILRDIRPSPFFSPRLYQRRLTHPYRHSAVLYHLLIVLLHLRRLINHDQSGCRSVYTTTDRLHDSLFLRIRVAFTGI